MSPGVRADGRRAGGWTLRAALGRARAVWREEGLRSLWFRALGETVYRRATLMEHGLDGAPRPAYPPGVEVGQLTPADLADYLRLRPDADPGEISRRLAGGQLCFVARLEGRLVHASWAATGEAWLDHLARRLPLAPDEALAYETYTAPACRGRGVAALRVAHELAYLRARGYRRALAVGVPEDGAGMRYMERVGYRRVGLVGSLRLGPWRWDFCRMRRGVPPPGATPRASPASWDEACERFAGAPHYLDSFLGQLKRDAYLGLIDRWGGARVQGRVLKTDLFEEGLGPDGFLPALAGDGRVVLGMDVSAALARRARARDPGGRVHHLAADSRALPFADEAFALIVCPSTLDHFPDERDLSRSLRELARVLRPGGCLIVTLDNRQNVFDPLLRLVNRLGWVPYYLGRSYRVGELRRALQAAGLVVEDTTAILHNPRLTAVAAVRLAARLGWPALSRAVQRGLLAAQRLEHTPVRYFTGSFIAARAVRPR